MRLTVCLWLDGLVDTGLYARHCMHFTLCNRSARINSNETMRRCTRPRPSSRQVRQPFKVFWKKKHFFFLIIFIGDPPHKAISYGFFFFVRDSVFV